MWKIHWIITNTKKHYRNRRKCFFGCKSFNGKLVFESSKLKTGSLELSLNLETIDAYAFSYCSGFTGSLKLPNNLTKIGNSAFSNCTGFNGSLELLNNLTIIENNAFSDCTGFISSLELPKNLI